MHGPAKEQREGLNREGGLHWQNKRCVDELATESWADRIVRSDFVAFSVRGTLAEVFEPRIELETVPNRSVTLSLTRLLRPPLLSRHL